MKTPVVINSAIVALALCTTAGGWPWSKSAQQQVTEAVTAQLDREKQQLFNSFHPVGTANSIKVHEVILQWKGNKNTNRVNDVVGFVVRFTVYWRSPLIDEGFTKGELTYDGEAERYVMANILQTNGRTREDILTGVAAFAGGFLRGYHAAASSQ